MDHPKPGVSPKPKTKISKQSKGAGKGDGERPMTISREEFGNRIDEIFGHGKTKPR